MKDHRLQEQEPKSRPCFDLGVNPEYEKARAKAFQKASRRIRKHFGISNKVKAKCDPSDNRRINSKL